MVNEIKNPKEKSLGSKIIFILIGLVIAYFSFRLIVSGAGDSANPQPNYQYPTYESTQEQIQQCNPNWGCGSYGDCKDGFQTRDCVDSNNCGTASRKPDISQSCTVNKEWHEVTTFQSSSSKKTETFLIKGDKWRFTWSCKKSNSYDGMNIAVYEPNNDAYTEFLFLQKCPISEETTFVYEGDAEYYFDISIANIDSWKIKVEEWN